MRGFLHAFQDTMKDETTTVDLFVHFFLLGLFTATQIPGSV